MAGGELMNPFPFLHDAWIGVDQAFVANLDGLLTQLATAQDSDTIRNVSVFDTGQCLSHSHCVL
jgi:hypothetical protein